MGKKVEINFEKISDAIHENTDKCSKIGRQIMLGLIATTWAFFFIGDKFISNFWLIASLLAGIFYFLIDFTQYLFITIAFRRLFKNANLILDQKEKIEVRDKEGHIVEKPPNNNFIMSKLREAVRHNQKTINNRSFLFFFIKFPFILFSFIFITAYIISKI
jgi:hypothetical protein